MPVKKTRKLTHYSRRGCVACKKSHVKCDEISPSCSRCKRKNIECTYVTNFFLENHPSNQNALTRTAFVWENNNAKLKLPKSEPGSSASNSNDKTTTENKSLQFQNTFKLIDRDEHSLLTRINMNINNPDIIIHNFNTTNSIPKMNNKTPVQSDSQSDISPNTQSTALSPIFPIQPPNNTSNNNLQQANILTPETHLSSKSNLTILQHSIDQSSDFLQKNNILMDSLGTDSSHQSSVSNIQLDDLVSVEQTDLLYIDSLNKGNEKIKFLYNETSQPNLYTFDIPWDGGPCVYFIDTIERHDPLVLKNDIALTDQKMIDFVWTFTRLTKFFYTFVMFSESSLISVLDLCFKLGTKNPIFQSIMTYHCSLHVVRIYKQGNNPRLANLWDTRVRIPAYKQCIGYLRQGLDSSPKFADIVVLTFAVLIIFSGNTDDQSWRTHLIGSYQLISKCALLKETANKNDVFDLAALEIYNIIVEWYNHTSLLAAVTSLNGFFGKQLKFETSLSSSTNLAIESNNINLISGHCLELNRIFSKIDSILATFNSRGIKLSGLNFVYFLLNNINSTDILNEFKVFGLELLNDLKILKTNYKYKRLPLDDFKMDLSMKYCNLIYIYGTELYITFFFVGNRDKDVIRSYLRDIIDLIYSMPYRSSCAIVCHYNIYIASIISLLIEDYQIYDHFLTILSIFELNGMTVLSIEVLERLKLILIEKNYEELLSPENDIVIY